MRLSAMLMGLAAAAMSLPLAAPNIGVEGVSPAIRSKVKRGKGHDNRRGKGKVDKAKRRSNRLHISRRVRRKHRRAA